MHAYIHTRTHIDLVGTSISGLSLMFAAAGSSLCNSSNRLTPTPAAVAAARVRLNKHIHEYTSAYIREYIYTSISGLSLMFAAAGSSRCNSSNNRLGARTAGSACMSTASASRISAGSSRSSEGSAETACACENSRNKQNTFRTGTGGRLFLVCWAVF